MKRGDARSARPLEWQARTTRSSGEGAVPGPAPWRRRHRPGTGAERLQAELDQDFAADAEALARSLPQEGRQGVSLPQHLLQPLPDVLLVRGQGAVLGAQAVRLLEQVLEPGAGL